MMVIMMIIMLLPVCPMPVVSSGLVLLNYLWNIADDGNDDNDDDDDFQV